MTLKLLNLDERTRKLMADEMGQDVSNGKLYMSPRLSERGHQQWVDLLRSAIDSGDDDSLATSLRIGGHLKANEQRSKPRGGLTTVAVPVTAAETLAEGEFNRYYARALCRRAIEDGISELVVYRAKMVDNPRPASEAKIGTRINPQALLQDLRTSQGVEPALGLPPGPNSGLSVRFP